MPIEKRPNQMHDRRRAQSALDLLEEELEREGIRPSRQPGSREQGTDERMRWKQGSASVTATQKGGRCEIVVSVKTSVLPQDAVATVKRVTQVCARRKETKR